jgi:hypothetical protein
MNALGRSEEERDLPLSGENLKKKVDIAHAENGANASPEMSPPSKLFSDMDKEATTEIPREFPPTILDNTTARRLRRR